MKLIIEIDNEAYKGLVTEGHIFVKHIFDSVKNGIPLEQIRDEIERLHYHPKLDFIKNDEVVEMALDIIDKYKGDKE